MLGVTVIQGEMDVGRRPRETALTVRRSLPVHEAAVMHLSSQWRSPDSGEGGGGPP